MPDLATVLRNYYCAWHRLMRDKRNHDYRRAVKAVRPWAVFRRTAQGWVELDTGDVIQ